ncbi:MAG TPA: methyltransferase domain-containing protein [Solirubrobacteraceae bacterium]|nr:methyltransferase domain-containing protein [Solirubrobacteraceae bacterium]
MRDYYEELWAALPDRLVPPDLDRRSGFLLEHLRPGLRVLDLGCGDGVFAELMLEHVPLALTLADVADAALVRARARPRLAGAEVTMLRVPFDGDLPLADAAFDLVWASEVIEHVADTGHWLSEVRRVLAPGGELLLSTPNHTRLRLALAGIEALSPPLGDHLHLYDRRGLRRLLDEFAFTAVNVRASGRLGPLSRLLLASARR